MRFRRYTAGASEIHICIKQTLMTDKFTANKILNDQEIQQRKIKLESNAKNLIVTLSSRCNLKCIMCEVRQTQWEIPQRVIDEIFEFFPYAESIIWQGGEPFLLDYFEELFDRACGFPQLKQTIVTNGLLFSEDWARKLVDSNVELVFSIDGVTKEVYESIRKGAKFDNVLRSIELINKARKTSISRNMSLRLHAVIMKSNYHQLEAFIDFAKENGFDAIHLISIWGNLDSEENIFYRQEKEALNYINAIRNRVEEKARKYNIQLLNSLPPPKECTNEVSSEVSSEVSGNAETDNNELICQLPWQQLNVDPGGGVRPGCLCLKAVGNVLESSLKEIWNNKQMQMYREKIVNGEYKSWCNPACLSGQIGRELRGS